MANNNDFKLIKLKSKKMFEYLQIQSSTIIDDLTKERLGFYHLILENVTGFLNSGEDSPEEESEFEKSCVIIDTEYNKYVNNVNDVDDLGIDAVAINKNSNDEIDIMLFNFKYRNSFNPDKTKSEGDVSRSTKFLEYIVRGDLVDETTNSLVASEINKIIKLNESNNICNLYMYMVSNEAKGFHTSSNEYIKILEKNYGMKIINISLDEIISFYNVKKDGYKSSFMISKDEFLSFQSDPRSTQKSFILKLSLLDLIRITTDNDTLSNMYSIENDDEILNSQLDFSLLYDNVRGYLGNTKYNKNIIDTLIKDHQYFFMFNNGITITAENIDCDPKNSGQKYLFTIQNFQIVNGGQTVRSIYSFLNDRIENEDSEELSDTEKIVRLREAYVLLRIFKTSKDDTLQNSIAEYTNSQNAISDIDLKSIDPIQIQIERYFSEVGVLYSRKAGDLGQLDKDYSSRITMEKMAQILYSSLGFPDRASNQKRRLFIDYYDSIFKSENFSLENCLKHLNKYNEIEIIYKKHQNNYKVTDQKIFYIIYIITFWQFEIEDAIEHLEKVIVSYGANVSEARKLIQKGFKDHLINSLTFTPLF